MLAGLRYFERSLTNNGRGKPKKAFSWGPVDMATVASCLVTLCQQVKATFMEEPRLLRVTSPSYVLGEYLFRWTCYIGLEDKVIVFYKMQQSSYYLCSVCVCLYCYFCVNFNR